MVLFSRRKSCRRSLSTGIKIRGNTRSKWSRTTIFSDDSLLSKAAPSARNVNIQFLRRAVYTRSTFHPLSNKILYPVYRYWFSLYMTHKRDSSTLLRTIITYTNLVLKFIFVTKKTKSSTTRNMLSFKIF